MKKIILVALVILASASFSTIEAKKDKKNKKKGQTEQPVQLKNSSDSLSYVAGMSVTMHGSVSGMRSIHPADQRS